MSISIMSLQHLKSLILSKFKDRTYKEQLDLSYVYCIKNVSPAERILLSQSGMYFLNQNHTNNIITSLEKISQPADAFLINKSESMPPIAVYTADCLPIVGWNTTQLFLAHLGWKGLHNGMLYNIKAQLHSKIDYVFIGASICQNNYTVQKDFIHIWLEKPFFNVCYDANNLTFSLREMAKRQIGIPDQNILSRKTCTYENVDYASYRRNKTPNRNLLIYSQIALI